MTTLLRIRATYSGTTVTGPAVSTFYFVHDGIVLVETYRQLVWDLYDRLKPMIHNGITITVAPEWETIDDATGAITSFGTATTPRTVTGTVSGAQAARATQYLLQWRTGGVVAGRRLAGRTFVPGVPNSAIAGGDVFATTLTNLRTAVSAWLDGMQEGEVPVVWSPTHGTSMPITSGSAWSKLAVLRSRRD